MPVKFLPCVLSCPEAPRDVEALGYAKRIDPAWRSTTSCLNSGVGAMEREKSEVVVQSRGTERRGQATKLNGSPKMHDPQTRRTRTKDIVGDEIIALLSDDGSYSAKSPRNNGPPFYSWSTPLFEDPPRGWKDPEGHSTTEFPPRGETERVEEVGGGHDISSCNLLGCSYAEAVLSPGRWKEKEHRRETRKESAKENVERLPRLSATVRLDSPDKEERVFKRTSPYTPAKVKDTQAELAAIDIMRRPGERQRHENFTFDSYSLCQWNGL
ncbi:hypothetical protein WN55_02012 [Dufourea novaeangliae]|uniref:Uncharacterized protein n=1 Tax=Dufourea novaeangliae TaxID=178035 RepID=A0A154NWR7_DUFNO|nr:hypothetical protein WN55_02012 [Dufourea novaeangliae]